MKIFIKKLYKALPFKKALFTLLKKCWVPPAAVYQHLYFNGEILVEVNAHQQFKIMHYGHQLENDLFWKGLHNGWEKYSMRVWAGLAARANVVFDVGANTGVYSLVASCVNHLAAVHAFEPFGAIHKKLAYNAAINNFDINCNCLAISNYTGDAVIYSDNKDFAYSVTVNQNLWVKDTEPITINIKTITLDDYIRQQQISSIDLMKIDVETHEPEVMEGFVTFFQRFKPILLIEILNEEVATKLTPYFDSAQFDFYNIDERTGIKKVPVLSQSDYYNFLIVPKEKAHLYNEKSFIHS